MVDIRYPRFVNFFIVIGKSFKCAKSWLSSIISSYFYWIFRTSAAQAAIKHKKCPYLELSGLHFPAFGLNTERYWVSLRIQSECGKMRIRMTPNTDTLHAVNVDLKNNQCWWKQQEIEYYKAKYIAEIEPQVNANVERGFHWGFYLSLFTA